MCQHSAESANCYILINNFIAYIIINTESVSELDTYQLVVYVPASHIEVVKDALFKAGAGRYDGYDRCSWQISGQGQFRPLSGAHPHTGAIRKLCKIEEIRLELMITGDTLEPSLAALRQSHPFEVPAYHLIKHHCPE